MKGTLALIHAKSLIFRWYRKKTREGSHLSDVTQLKSETVYGTVMKSLDSGVRQMTNTRLSDTTERLN